MADPDSLLRARMSDSPEALRLPDQYSRPTAATVLKAEYTVSSDAAGDAFWGENAGLSNSKLTSTITAGVLGSITTAAHPQYTSFTAEAKVARTVLVKVQVIYIGRNDAAAGFLSYDEKTETSFGSTNLSDHHTSALVQVDAEHGMAVALTFSQEPRWEAPTGGTYMANTFPVATFFASGLPVSSPVFRVRVWRYVEYLPFDGAISEGSMVVEPYNPSAMAVHSLLAGVSTSVSKGATTPPMLKQLANAAYHMAAPVGKWVVNEARSFLQSKLGGMVMTGAKLLL